MYRFMCKSVHLRGMGVEIGWNVDRIYEWDYGWNVNVKWDGNAEEASTLTDCHWNVDVDKLNLTTTVCTHFESVRTSVPARIDSMYRILVEYTECDMGYKSNLYANLNDDQE